MKSLSYIWLLLIFTTLSGCINNEYLDEYSDQNIEIKAEKVVKHFDNNSINIFNKWNYITRGKGGIWIRVKADSVLYRCTYYTDSDTINLRVFEPNAFEKDFPIFLKFDTNGYFRFQFSKFNNKIRVTATDTNGRDHILLKNANTTDIFKTKNPFDTLGKLNSLKDSLKFIGISRYGNIGNFIQFYLSSQHILTYLPNNFYIKPQFKVIWLKDFATGKTLNKSWNLRKLPKPLDNG